MGDHGELLEGGDDDGLAGLERVLELARGGVDVLDDAQRLFKLAHRGLQLAVKHAAVGDHDDGVENAAVIGTVEGGQLVGKPCDGKGLAASRGVLNQVAPPRSLLACAGYQLSYTVELLVAGEDQEAVARFPTLLVLLLYFVDELAHQVQHAIGRPDFLPKVGGGVASPVRRDGRVAGAAELALIEGQETRPGFGQMGRHIDQIGVDGEVRQAAPVGEQGLTGVTVGTVLANGVLNGLTGERVLELGGEDGNAIEKERKVQAIVVFLAVVELPDNGEEVGQVHLSGFFIEPAGRAEVGEPEAAAHVLDPVAQHVERAPVANLGRQTLQEALFHLVSMVLGQSLPLPGLRRQHEVQYILGDKAESRVIVLGKALGVATGCCVQIGASYIANLALNVLE